MTKMRTLPLVKTSQSYPYKGQLTDEQGMPAEEEQPKVKGQVPVHGGTAGVGDHLDNFGKTHKITKVSRDGRKVTTTEVGKDGAVGLAREAHVSSLAHMRKVPAPKPLDKRDPAAGAPTPKPPKVGVIPKPPAAPKVALPKAPKIGVSMSTATVGMGKAEYTQHSSPEYKAAGELTNKANRLSVMATSGRDGEILHPQAAAAHREAASAYSKIKLHPDWAGKRAKSHEAMANLHETDPGKADQHVRTWSVTKAEPKGKSAPPSKMPHYSEKGGWKGGEKNRLYHITDKRSDKIVHVRPVEHMSPGVGPEVNVRHATRAEAEQHWQNPLHPGWKVEEPVAKAEGCPTCRTRGEDNHLVDLYHTAKTALSDKPAEERTDYHRKLWASAAFAKEHPGATQTGAYKKLDRITGQPAGGASRPSGRTTPRLEGKAADDFKRKMGVCMEPGCQKIDKHDGEHTSMRKSEHLAAARLHYARLERAQKLHKAESAQRHAELVAAHLAAVGVDHRLGLPAEVRATAGVDLTKTSHPLDRLVLGLPRVLPSVAVEAPMDKVENPYDPIKRPKAHTSWARKNNPHQVGDKVRLSDDALLQHSRSVPAHAGYGPEGHAWRKTLGGLSGQVGTVSRVFPGSAHTNVDFNGGSGAPGGQTIGIEHTSLVPHVESIAKAEDSIPGDESGDMLTMAEGDCGQLPGDPLQKLNRTMRKALTGSASQALVGVVGGAALGKGDSRYQIAREYTGHASGKPQHVVRFAGDFIGSHPTPEGAAAIQQNHASERQANLDKGEKRKDGRYAISKEFTGHASGKVQHVVRFAGDFVGSHPTKEGAEAIRNKHAAKRQEDLRPRKPSQ